MTYFFGGMIDIFVMLQPAAASITATTCFCRASSSEFKINSKDDTVKLYFNDDVADLVIKSGLIDWVINKAT